jgi:hypothetical protein
MIKNNLKYNKKKLKAVKIKLNLMIRNRIIQLQ